MLPPACGWVVFGLVFLHLWFAVPSRAAVVDDGSDALALALLEAYASALEAGEIVAKDALLLAQGAYFAKTQVFDICPTSNSLNASSIPLPGRAGLLDTILKRGTLRVASVCSRQQVGYNNQKGVSPPAGPIGAQWTAVVVRLGLLYGEQQLATEFVCVNSDFDAIQSLEQRSVDVVDSQTWRGGETSTNRWSSIVRPAVSFTAFIDSYQVLSSSNLRSVADLVNVLVPTTIIATVGESSRQILQAVFPQLPPGNLVNAGSPSALSAMLQSKAALATFDAPITTDGPPTTELLGRTLTPRSWFTRYSVGAPDITSPAGLEAFASAVEAGWANLAFTGVRELVLGFYANVQLLLDASPSPSVLSFPDQVGLLAKVVQNYSVTIGELRSGPALIDPWFTVEVDNSTGVPVEVPSGATVSVLQAIFNAIGVVYSVPAGQSIELVWRFYDTPNQLFAALQAGEIDMTAGMTGVSNVVNGTVDWLAFRRLVALYGQPLNLYFQSRLFNADVEINAVLSSISGNGTIDGASVLTVAVPSDLHASLLRAYVPGFGASTRITIAVLSDAASVVDAVINGSAMFGFVEQNTAATAASNIRSVCVGYRPIVPFVKSDRPATLINLARLRYVRWSSAAAIIIATLVAILALLFIASALVLVRKRRSVVVEQSNLLLNLILLLGLVIGVCTTLTYGGKVTDGECALRPWLAGLGSALVLGVLVAKLHFVNTVLNNTSLAERVSPMNQLTLTTVAIVVAVEVLLLIIWTAVARLRSRVRQSADNNDLVLVCSAHTLWVFLGLQIAYAALLILFGVYLSIRIRKVATQVVFSEPKWISYTIYALGLCLLVTCLLSGFLWNSYLVYFLAVSLAIAITAGLSFVLLFGHKARLLFMDDVSVSNSSAQNTPSFTTNMSREH